jgi:hypothetical protein
MEACGEFRIFSGASNASNPTGTAVDNANTYVVFNEAAPATVFPARRIFVMD